MNNFEKKAYITDVAAIRAAVEKVPLIGTALAGINAPAAAAPAVQHTVTVIVGGPLPAGTITQAPVPAAVAAVIAAAKAKIAAWGAAAIDWTQVTAAQLTALYKLAISANPNTLLDYTTGLVTVVDGNGVVIPNGIPSPNFEIQGRVLRGVATTEAERAFVFHNNVQGTDPDSINARFTGAADGTQTAR
jgi:hypothetical protein